MNAKELAKRASDDVCKVFMDSGWPARDLSDKKVTSIILSAISKAVADERERCATICEDNNECGESCHDLDAMAIRG